MGRASNILEKIVKEEEIKLSCSFSGNSYHAIQHILRRLDFILLFYHKDLNRTDEEVEELLEYYNYGWAPAIKPFYNNINISTFEPFPEMFKEARDWADSTIIFAGKLALCKQLIVYEKADLIELLNPKENEFTFKYKIKNSGIEHFDQLSLDFFRDKIIEQHINKEKEKLNFDEIDIKKKLRAIIKNPSGKYISYETTTEIDEYFDKLGHFHVLRLQGYDNFGEKDKFGAIEYRKYLELLELIVGVAIMHTEACIELTKINPNVDLHNLLTYTHFKDKTIDIYSNYYGTSKEEIEQILSCITLNKDNFNYYLDYPSVSLPMYVQVSENLIVRLISGCLGNPFEMLNRELKRKYKKDYDIAVNKREKRFRTELFHLFPQERIIKIPREINISFKGIKTDIDAVVFDKKTKTLGIFQLKWQDPFSRSMTERYSRISNLFKKANEWLEKIQFWFSNNSTKTILNALQIDKKIACNSEINDVYVFVLSRNNMNFTTVKVDDRVAWGTWYQLIESQASIPTDFDDPIREMYIKLKMFSPEQRLKRDNLPEKQNFDTWIGKYRIYYNEK